MDSINPLFRSDSLQNLGGEESKNPVTPLTQSIRAWFSATKNQYPDSRCTLRCHFPKSASGAYRFSIFSTKQKKFLKIDLQWEMIVLDREGKEIKRESFPQNSENPILEVDYIYLQYYTISEREPARQIEEKMAQAFDVLRAYRKELLVKEDPDTHLPPLLADQNQKNYVANILKKQIFSITVETDIAPKMTHPHRRSIYRLNVEKENFATPTNRSKDYTIDHLARKAFSQMPNKDEFPPITHRQKRYLSRFVLDQDPEREQKIEQSLAYPHHMRTFFLKEIRQQEIDLYLAKKKEALLQISPEELLARLKESQISEKEYGEYLEETSHYYADYLDALIDKNRMTMGQLAVKKQRKKQFNPRQRDEQSLLAQLNQDIAEKEKTLLPEVIAMEETALFLEQLRDQAR